MGLAASQARFLAITSRKTNCEFQSMQIAQNKLSITRELAQATQDYQNSLNATKLVWDYDCDNTGYLAAPCENAKSLAFNTLMIPSVYNNFQPYLVTTRTGAVVLNSKYATAASAAGIDGHGGHPRSQAGFNEFLNELVNQDLLPESTNKEIQKGNFVIYQGKMAEDGGTTYVYDHILDPANSDDEKLINDNRLVTVPKYALMDENGYTLEIDASGNKIYKDPDGNVIKDKTFNDEKFIETVINENGYIKGYDPNAGFGSTPMSKNSTIASDLLGLSIKLDTITNFVLNKYVLKDENGNTLEKDANGNKIYKDPDGNVIEDTTGLNEEDFKKTAINIPISDNITESNSHKIAINGGLIDTETANEISIGDLLTNDVTIIYTFADNNEAKEDNGFDEKDPDLSDIKSKMNASMPMIFDTPITAIVDKLKEVTQYDHTILDYAVAATKKLFSVNAMNGEAVDSHDTAGAVQTAISQANNYNSLYGVTTKGKKDNCSVAYSLSNVLACILTLADRYTTNSNKYSVSPKVADSNYVTMDNNYSYPINSSNSNTQTILQMTDFYMQLYNNICINGWTKSEAVDNAYNFNQLIKNGTYFISSINDDGYFYQGRYNAIDKLIEVKDEDAIAQAELEFQRIKATLTYKEDKLDLDMKNLDAEISSLTTELDSVKNLISKNIEKTFTMYQ